MKTLAILSFLAVALILAGCVGQAAQPAATAGAPTATPTSAAQGGQAVVVVATATPQAQASAASVKISGFAFSPADLPITAGTKVTWTNDDSTAHSIVSSDLPALSSPILPNGGTYEFTFAQPGTYAYHCGIHASMKGTVTVT